jgi:acetyl esterase/lipase
MLTASRNHVVVLVKVVVSMSYRLAPKWTLKHQMIDCKLAIKWILEHANDYGITSSLHVTTSHDMHRLDS